MDGSNRWCKTSGHTDVPPDGLKTVSQREFISQETGSVYYTFIVDILEHKLKKPF